MSANHHSNLKDLNYKDSQLFLMMKRKSNTVHVIKTLEKAILMWIAHTLKKIILLQITHPIQICHMTSYNGVDHHGWSRELVSALIQHYGCEFAHRLVIDYRATYVYASSSIIYGWCTGFSGSLGYQPLHSPFLSYEGAGTPD